MYESIKDLGEAELLAMLAEEASELAQAALKLRRAIDGRNPTPQKEVSCRASLEEEVADMRLVLRYLGLTEREHIERQVWTETRKEMRWVQRLSGESGEDAST